MQIVVVGAGLFGSVIAEALTRDGHDITSWLANKYSVPMAYQRTQVGVSAEDGQLLIFDSMTTQEIARHTLHSGKGNIIKNNNHYRDLSQTIAQHEEDICDQLGRDLGQRLCQCLHTAFPDCYKDQLAGFKSILKQHQPLNMEVLERLSQRPSVSARQAREFLEAYRSHPERLLQSNNVSPASAALVQQLTAYSNLPVNEQEVGHEYY